MMGIGAETEVGAGPGKEKSRNGAMFSFGGGGLHRGFTSDLWDWFLR